MEGRYRLALGYDFEEVAAGGRTGRREGGRSGSDEGRRAQWGSWCGQGEDTCRSSVLDLTRPAEKGTVSGWVGTTLMASLLFGMGAWGFGAPGCTLPIIHLIGDQL
jgi:hypothetical protein